MSKKQTTKKKSTKKALNSKKSNKTSNKKSLDKIFKPIPNNPIPPFQRFPDLKEALPGELPEEPKLVGLNSPSSGHILFWRKSTIEIHDSNHKNLNLSIIVSDDQSEVFDSFFKQTNPTIILNGDHTRPNSKEQEDIASLTSEYSLAKDIVAPDYLGNTIVLIQDNNAAIIAGPWFFEPYTGNPFHTIIPSLIACKHLNSNYSPYLLASLTNSIAEALNPVCDNFYPEVEEEKK